MHVCSVVVVVVVVVGTVRGGVCTVGGYMGWDVVRYGMVEGGACKKILDMV